MRKMGAQTMESQNIEWKEVWRDEYSRTICGFANASGGVLEIGRCDDGKIIVLRMLRNCWRICRIKFAARRA